MNNNKKVIALASFITGVFWTLISWVLLLIVDPSLGYLSWTSGILFALMLYLCMNAIIFHTNKKYEKAKKSIGSEIKFETSANFFAANGVKNAKIYLCDDKIVMLSLEKKPYISDTLEKSNFFRYETDGIVKMTLYTKDGLAYSFSSSEIGTLTEKMREYGWIM